MNQQINEFLQAKKLAIVGVSRSPQKFGTAIYNELKTRGFEVFGVNPLMETISGDKCYPNLTALTGMVDGVVISLPPQKVAAVLHEAASAGISRVWLQQGSQSKETETVAREAGIVPVTGKCILMYAGEVKSIHAFHRFFARLFGQY